MLTEVAKTIRGLSVDAIEKANSGHPGLPLGCAEIGAVLFGEILKHDPEKPDWFDRDRFILSAGHGSISVSYTHLDVYKRQALWAIIPSRSGWAAMIAAACF